MDYIARITHMVQKDKRYLIQTQSKDVKILNRIKLLLVVQKTFQNVSDCITFQYQTGLNVCLQAHLLRGLLSLLGGVHMMEQRIL